MEGTPSGKASPRVRSLPVASAVVVLQVPVRSQEVARLALVRLTGSLEEGVGASVAITVASKEAGSEVLGHLDGVAQEEAEGLSSDCHPSSVRCIGSLAVPG